MLSLFLAPLYPFCLPSLFPTHRLPANTLRLQLKTIPPTITQMKKRRLMKMKTLTLTIQRARMVGLGTCLATVGT